MRRTTTSAIIASVILRSLIAAAVLVGCGVRPDSQPQEISRDSLPRGLFETQQGTGDLSGPQATIYVVTTGAEPKLQPVNVPISGDGDPAQEVLGKLVTYMPAAADKDIKSPVSGTRLLGVSHSDNTLNIDLANTSVEGVALQQAFAQMVFTVTALPGIESVRFSLNGKATSVPLGNRTVEPGSSVTRADFNSLTPLATTTTATSAVPASTTTVPPRTTTGSGAR